ncbi:MAG: di-trans,poly-cis-decaprenylcistransferase, partial [Actinobacteria bacterium]|nr:di-trans,poly-cis-decaprenylcistransferase [Actinomycetota bacterium]
MARKHRSTPTPPRDPATYRAANPHRDGATPPNIAEDRLPQHVAIVMDGNGRWANQRGLPRTRGHEMGEDSLLDVVHGALELKIPWVSAYAFSTENWKRSPEEVRFLMGFNRDVVHRRLDELDELGVRVRWAGRPKRLWKSVINELRTAEQRTQHNTAMNLVMCVNYGGRAEIADSVVRIAQLVREGKISPDRITEATIARYLDEPEMPDVDLFLRSSGEQRTSNFLLWQ